MKITMSQVEAEAYIKNSFHCVVESVEIVPRYKPTNTPGLGLTSLLLQEIRVARKRDTSGYVNKIGMIKAVRAATGWGLQDAKDLVEAIFG